MVQPADSKISRDDPHEAYVAIQRFLGSSRQPVLMEPGEDSLPIAPDNFALHFRNGIVTIESWSETRNLVRRVRGIHRGIHETRRGRLELTIERFGGRPGTLTLLDLADSSNRDADRRGARLKYRERFRRSLRRQFPEWRLAELSTEPDLHNSLSPSYPRALLRKGSAGLAAIGAGEDSLSPEAALSFGLIWLDYLRRREPRLAIQGLAIFVPAGAEAATCHRIQYLNPKAAQYLVFAHDAGGQEDRVDPGDYTNLATRLNPWRQASTESCPRLAGWVDRIASLPAVERREHPDGSVALAIHGLEFARAMDGELLFGLDHKHVAGGETHLREIEQLAQGLSRMRHADAVDRMNPLYCRHPEAWLESQVRGSLDRLDASLLPSPVYGQVPQFAGGDRGVIDLLAADCDGRLVVVELKATQDIHLPLQALDYWMRVKWHLDRGEFSGRGYFPGIAIRSDPPRLLLAAPALEYHPSNEQVLRYFSPEILVERLGVGLEWKKELRVMFSIPSRPWHSQYFAR